jgi:hypothetical protein
MPALADVAQLTARMDATERQWLRGRGRGAKSLGLGRILGVHHQDVYRTARALLHPHLHAVRYLAAPHRLELLAARPSDSPLSSSQVSTLSAGIGNAIATVGIGPPLPDGCPT